MKSASDSLPIAWCYRSGYALSAGLIRACVLLALLAGFLTSAEAQTEKLQAIAELTAAGLSWDEGERAVSATAEGQHKLKDLAAVQRALRLLQPREIDFGSCSALQQVDGLRGLRSLHVIQLSECPVLQNVDGIVGSDQLKKVYLFESKNIAAKSLEALERRFPKCYIVLPDGTGLNPPREEEAGGNR